ncbi:MAG: DNA mismatch repair endonuclease MutL [Verrucomicrobiota bacterium]
MTRERHIQLLPDHVANKIAAGEVVDRPASVVKELVENGLDAGATQLMVEVTAGGRKVIAVSDNGSGMNRDDALLCVERHATSKIRTADDIERVSTLGFRGEALAAISAVSHFTLSTRQADALGGTEVVISGGKVQEVRDVGCPAGTTVHVRHVFFNVPARRKFLRSEQTELAHVRQTFLVYAVSHPAIGFRLVADGREVYRLAAGAAVEDRLRELFGPDLLRSLRPVEHRSEGMTLTGYAGLPGASRSDRAEQFIFINRRPAGAPLLNYALSEAYHALLPRGRYPVVYLYLEMDPTLVDVNVHPAKKEVRFRRPSDVRDMLINSIRQALTHAPGAAAGRAEMPAAAGAAPPEPQLAIEGMPAARTFSYPRLPMVPAEPGSGSGAAVQAVAGTGEEKPSAASPWSWCRVLGQVGGLYVVLETEDGVVLMDPHAAHERLLYERYMKEVGGDRVASQGLLTAETVELSPGDAQRVRDNLPLLKKMGFGVSEFGGDAFMIDALPTCLGSASGAALLGEVAQTLEHAGARGGAERWAEEQIAQGACKAAVKARDRLTLDEIEQLVVDLARAEMPYTCPHGRPTIVFTSFDELHRKFGRA